MNTIRSKNISVNIKQNEKVPYKETYIVIRKTKKAVRIVQKFKDQSENQEINLNYKECERLMNLMHFFVFESKYRYNKDKVLIIRENI